VQRLKALVDLDAIAAGCATTRGYYGAARSVLIAAAIGLIEGIITQDMMTTINRVLKDKFPHRLNEAIQVFRELVEGFFKVVPDPTPNQVQPFMSQVTDPDDAPILAAAILSGCKVLVTFNTRHYLKAKGVLVMRPEAFLQLMEEGNQRRNQQALSHTKLKAGDLRCRRSGQKFKMPMKGSFGSSSVCTNSPSGRKKQASQKRNS